MVGFRQIFISKALAFCLVAGALGTSAAPVLAAESEASSSAGSEASTQSSTQASGSSASEASRSSSSEAGASPSTSAVTQSASETGNVGRPTVTNYGTGGGRSSVSVNPGNSRGVSAGGSTVINRGNVGSQILQAAGQKPAVVRNYRRSKRKPAHWKTQTWNQGK